MQLFEHEADSPSVQTSRPKERPGKCKYNEAKMSDHYSFIDDFNPTKFALKHCLILKYSFPLDFSKQNDISCKRPNAIMLSHRHSCSQRFRE